MTLPVVWKEATRGYRIIRIVAHTDVIQEVLIYQWISPKENPLQKKTPLVSAVLPRTPLRPTAGVLIFKEISN